VYQDTPQPIVINKEEVVQDKEVFLYKLYAISLETSRPTTSEPILLKEEFNNLFNKIEKRTFNIEKKLWLNLSNKNTIQIYIIKISN